MNQSTPGNAPAPVVYEAPVTITSEDIDGLGHVNNVVYLRWVQQVATAHWQNTATPQQQAEYAWVALRHEIDYLRPSFLEDSLIARTYVGSVTGVRFERFVEIVNTADSQVIAKSRSIWVAIDPQTRRPRKVDAAMNALFFG